jgi:hypothetical protein
MSRFSKFTVAAILGGAGLLLTPAPAPAQFYGGFGRPFMGGGVMPSPYMGAPYGGVGIGGMGYGGMGLGGLGLGGVGSFGLQPLPGLASLRPLSSFPFGGSGYNYIAAPFGGGYGGGGYGFVGGPYTTYVGGYAVATYGMQYLYGPSGSGSGGYASLDPYQQHFYKAQQAAGLYSSDGAKSQIYDQRAYEAQGGGPASRPAGPSLEVLQKALAASSEAEVASGEALNHILAAVQTREGKGTKPVPAAYLPPNLVAEVRFGGTPAGEALNLLRSSGRLPVPAAFDADALRGTKEALQRDFAAVAAPLLAGKPVDQAKVAKLAQTVKEAQQKLTPVGRDLPFPEAAEARRFLAQMEATTKVLREAGSVALVNPKWATEGTNVTDLVKHMTKNKLQFGPVDKGNEEAYLTLHRALRGYLFALDQAQAAKK